MLRSIILIAVLICAGCQTAPPDPGDEDETPVEYSMQ